MAGEMPATRGQIAGYRMIFAADTRYQGGEWRDIRLRAVPNGGFVKQCAVASPMAFPVAVSLVSRAAAASS